MFNYVGRIVGDVQESKSVEFTTTVKRTTSKNLSQNLPVSDQAEPEEIVTNSTTYGLDLYAVQIPAISQDPVAATVLSFPGIALKYKVDDIVLIGEIEEKSKAGFTYVILGALQKQDAINNLEEASVANIKLDTLDIKSGTIDSSVKIQKSGSASTSGQQIELTELWNNVNSVQYLKNAFPSTYNFSGLSRLLSAANNTEPQE